MVVVKASSNGPKTVGSSPHGPSRQKPAPRPRPAGPRRRPRPRSEAPPPEPVKQEKPPLAKGMTMDKVRELWGEP